MSWGAHLVKNGRLFVFTQHLAKGLKGRQADDLGIHLSKQLC